MTVYHAEKYSIENMDKHCCLYWSPSTNKKDGDSIKEDLLFQRQCELILEFKRINNTLQLSDISSVLQSEITSNQFKVALSAFYEKIRHCSCQYQDNQLFIFSEQKRIDISIKLWQGSGKFVVKGNNENLVRFLHAYCDCVNTILKKALFTTPNANQFAADETITPNNDIQDLLDFKSIENLDPGDIPNHLPPSTHQHNKHRIPGGTRKRTKMIPNTPQLTPQI